MTKIKRSQKCHRHRESNICKNAARICRLIEVAVAATFALPVNELRAASRRDARAAFARQNTMYLAHVALGLNCEIVGRIFHRDRTTAAHACQVVEMRRDNPTIDRQLDALEDLCVEIARDIPMQTGARP